MERTTLALAAGAPAGAGDACPLCHTRVAALTEAEEAVMDMISAQAAELTSCQLALAEAERRLAASQQRVAVLEEALDVQQGQLTVERRHLCIALHKIEHHEASRALSVRSQAEAECARSEFARLRVAAGGPRRALPRADAG